MLSNKIFDEDSCELFNQTKISRNISTHNELIRCFKDNFQGEKFAERFMVFYLYCLVLLYFEM